MITRRHLLPAVLLCLLAGCSHDLRQFGADCRVETAAELPLTLARNFLLAPVTLEGVRMAMVVDTGSGRSLLTPETVARLSLPSDPNHDSILQAVGRLVRSQNVTVRRVDIGRIVWSGGSFGVGEIGTIGGTALPIAGLLGADFLARYDVELDVPAARMTLHAVSGCTGLVPWNGEATAVPTRIDAQRLATLPVIVDDRPVRALLDTGARKTLMTRRLAASLGVTDAMLSADPVSGGTGVGLASIALRRHVFSRVSVGPSTVRDMPVNVADLRIPGVDMLLGADWLGPRHIWLSYSGGAVFIR